MIRRPMLKGFLNQIYNPTGRFLYHIQDNVHNVSLRKINESINSMSGFLELIVLDKRIVIGGIEYNVNGFSILRLLLLRSLSNNSYFIIVNAIIQRIKDQTFTEGNKSELKECLRILKQRQDKEVFTDPDLITQIIKDINDILNIDNRENDDGIINTNEIGTDTDIDVNVDDEEFILIDTNVQINNDTQDEDNATLDEYEAPQDVEEILKTSPVEIALHHEDDEWIEAITHEEEGDNISDETDNIWVTGNIKIMDCHFQ